MAAPKNKTAAKPAAKAPAAPAQPSVGTAIEILQYFATSQDTPSAKLAYLEANVSGGFKTLLTTMLDHANYRGNGKPAPDPKQYVQRMYSLLNVLVGILETADEAERGAMLDIANLVISQHNSYGEAFSPFTLLEHDYLWSWGTDTLHAFQFVAVIMSKLANPDTRAKELRSINLNSELYTANTSLSDVAVNNLIAYYTA